MSQKVEQTENKEDPIIAAAIASAARAKTITRMILILRVAKPPARKWFEQNQDIIQEYARAIQKVQGDDKIEVPEPIFALFKNLPYYKKKKEIEDRYDSYYQAWVGILNQKGSKGVMLAKLNYLNRHHNLSQENSEQEILVALCDALSGYSVDLQALENNPKYIS